LLHLNVEGCRKLVLINLAKQNGAHLLVSIALIRCAR
jgi:hypothetical protein